VGIHDLAILHIGPFTVRNLLADELMETRHADPRLPLVMAMVVVADVGKTSNAG
jgi:hypothetical protein